MAANALSADTTEQESSAKRALASTSLDAIAALGLHVSAVPFLQGVGTFAKEVGGKTVVGPSKSSSAMFAVAMELESSSKRAAASFSLSMTVTRSLVAFVVGEGVGLLIVVHV